MNILPELAKADTKTTFSQAACTNKQGCLLVSKVIWGKIRFKLDGSFMQFLSLSKMWLATCNIHAKRSAKYA